MDRKAPPPALTSDDDGSDGARTCCSEEHNQRKRTQPGAAQSLGRAAQHGFTTSCQAGAAPSDPRD